MNENNRNAVQCERKETTKNTLPFTLGASALLEMTFPTSLAIECEITFTFLSMGQDVKHVSIYMSIYLKCLLCLHILKIFECIAHVVVDK